MNKNDNQIKFALDVNTKCTGWSLWVNNTLTGYGSISTPGDTRKGLGKPMKEDYYQIIKGLAPVFMNLRHAIEKEQEEGKKKNTYMMIGIENSKIRVGADTQQKMDLYTGMYMGYISHALISLLPKVKADVKLITAAWQDKIFKKQEDANSKISSRKFASALLPEGHNELTIENDPGGDKADAICIGYILEELQDHGVAHWEKGNKSKNMTRIKSKLQNAKEKLAEYKLRSAERVQKGLKPTDAQLALKINTKEKEIISYEQELAKWKTPN